MLLDCETTKELLSEYLDGELAGPRTWEVRLHLEGCAACARLAAELAATVAALHGLATRREGAAWPRPPGSTGPARA